jgi:TrmH family RNA methyltransferase
MEIITSLANPRFKSAMRLHAARGRMKQNRIVVFGFREVVRAMEAGLVFEELMLDVERVSAESRVRFERQVENSGSSNASVLGLTRQLFDKLKYGDRTEDVIGIANRPETELVNIRTNENSVLVVLESIEKPGNIGAIARSADGCGADGLLLADPISDVYHPNAIRSSVSTVFSVPVACDRSKNVAAWLIENDYRVFIGTPEATTSIYETNLTGRVAFVFGNEANGLTDSWRLADWNRIKLPMSGTADSLNVSVTASLMMYEARRQNGFH